MPGYKEKGVCECVDHAKVYAKWLYNDLGQNQDFK